MVFVSIIIITQHYGNYEDGIKINTTTPKTISHGRGMGDKEINTKLPGLKTLQSMLLDENSHICYGFDFGCPMTFNLWVEKAHRVADENQLEALMTLGTSLSSLRGCCGTVLDKGGPPPPRQHP
jgi:hypothetical protein